MAEDESRREMSQKSVQQFTEELSCSAPVPGGGGAAALSAAMAAALGGMVANLTIGKKAYASVDKQVREMEKRLQVLREEFLKFMDRDAQAFAPLSRAFKLPRQTEEEKRHRVRIMEACLYEAAAVPLDMMEKIGDLLDILDVLADIGSSMTISDVGVAVQCARNALTSSSMNVFVNTGMMKDRHVAEEMERRANDWLEKGGGKADVIYGRVLDAVHNG